MFVGLHTHLHLDALQSSWNNILAEIKIVNLLYELSLNVQGAFASRILYNQIELIIVLMKGYPLIHSGEIVVYHVTTTSVIYGDVIATWSIVISPFWMCKDPFSNTWIISRRLQNIFDIEALRPSDAGSYSKLGSFYENIVSKPPWCA